MTADLRDRAKSGAGVCKPPCPGRGAHTFRDGCVLARANPIYVGALAGACVPLVALWPVEVRLG